MEISDWTYNIDMVLTSRKVSQVSHSCQLLPITLVTIHSLLIGRLLLIFFLFFLIGKVNWRTTTKKRKFPWCTKNKTRLLSCFTLSYFIYLCIFFWAASCRLVSSLFFIFLFFLVSPLRSETIDWPQGLLLFCCVFLASLQSCKHCRLASAVLFH